MRETLNKIGKPIVFAFGILSALLLVWSLIFFTEFTSVATDYYNNALDVTTPTIRQALREMYGKDGYVAQWENVDAFYRAAQSFNHTLFTFGVVMLVIFAVTLIASNHSRIKFYLSNLIIGVAANLTAIVYGIIVLVKNFSVSGIFAKHYEALNIFGCTTDLGYKAVVAAIKDGTYESLFNISGYPFTLTTIFMIVFILVAICNLAFTVLKFVYSNRKVEE